MFSPNADPPPRIVLDAGPLITLMHLDDRDHGDAVEGFGRLAAARARLSAPLPIVFEVYKPGAAREWRTGGRACAGHMRRALDLVFPTPADFDQVVAVAEAMGSWRGTLEDALVAVVALREAVPVWTLDYRDLSAFPRLRFWKP